jgi:hypothetical protein
MAAEIGELKQLGVDDPVIGVAEEPKQPGTWAGRRLLWLGDKPAFELSLWCGTCPFLFKRMEGANRTLSIAEMSAVLDAGLTAIDPTVVETFARLLPRGQYLPVLVEVQPTLVYPATEHDYYSHEQVATWGIDSFWGLPEYPQTPYYRTFEARVDDGAHLYEFVVPMVPPGWNEQERVRSYRNRLSAGDLLTAVAMSTLDLCQPADKSDAAPDYYQHCGLTHFLLDGHHKLQAASDVGASLQLLSLIAVDASLATEADVRRAVRARGGPQAARSPA